MSNEIQRHERYKQYAYYAYHLENAKFPKGTKILGVAENPETGFSGYVLQENNRIVIVYKGSDDFRKNISDTNKDWKNDINMALKKQIPAQTRDALELYDRIKHDFQNIPIAIIGHSLGGSLAQYVAILRKVDEVITFNPVGIGKSMSEYLSKYGSKTPVNNVINYNNPNDILTKFFRGDLYGTNYSIDVTGENKNDHNLENMKPLSTRKKAGVNSGVNNGGSSHSQKGCAGSYQVSGYTRADGTKVEGYTRRCGAKHAGISEEERLIGQAKYKGKKFQDLSDSELQDAISFFI